MGDPDFPCEKGARSRSGSPSSCGGMNIIMDMEGVDLVPTTIGPRKGSGSGHGISPPSASRSNTGRGKEKYEPMPYRVENSFSGIASDMKNMLKRNREKASIVGECIQDWDKSAAKVYNNIQRVEKSRQGADGSGTEPAAFPEQGRLT